MKEKYKVAVMLPFDLPVEEVEADSYQEAERKARQIIASLHPYANMRQCPTLYVRREKDWHY